MADPDEKQPPTEMPEHTFRQSAAYAKFQETKVQVKAARREMQREQAKQRWDQALMDAQNASGLPLAFLTPRLLLAIAAITTAGALFLWALL